MSHRDLSRLPTFDNKEECWRAIVETPKGSPYKFDYDPKFNCFELAKSLPEGMAFPLDFGFFPSTLGQDGDPLDVLVLMDFPAIMGVVVPVRVIGAIKAEQKENDGGWVRNDRIMAVAKSSRTFGDVTALDDLRSGMVKEIVAFFEQYNELEGKKFRSKGECGPKDAEALLEKGRKHFSRRA